MNLRWQQCWDACPEIYAILKESNTLESAREMLINYLNGVDWSYRKDLGQIESWDYILLKESLRCLENIISPRNERLAGCSSLEYLWKAAREGDVDAASDDFVEEFVHLFKALKGNSDVYSSHFMEGVESIDFTQSQGRAAAVKRSNMLDVMHERMDAFTKRYSSGLEPDIITKRKKNRERILEELQGSPDDWDDWKWQFKNVFKNSKGLEKIKRLIRMTPEQEEATQLAVKNDVVFGVTPYYLSLMDHEPSQHDFAVRRQVLPPYTYVNSMIEHRSDRGTAFDFMREQDTSPVDLVTRRYPRVAILKPYDTCPQICVYCQRNWEITQPLDPAALASDEKIEHALDWYVEHPSMMDVLLTGGDPLVMPNSKIEHILGRICEISSIKSIRIATRIPLTVPQRITEELCEIFGSFNEPGKRMLCMVTHAEHPYEITPETAGSIQKVRKQGMTVYNQEVFTFANSRRFETAALRIVLKSIGIDPYYTFNMKGKSEISDYAVPVARILQERKEEARLLPGVFRTDEPVFNVPFLGKNHLRAWQDHELISILPDGKRMYSFHAWEKNITKVKPYLYTDVSIKHYLNRLKERGEDPEDYKSIWYYY